MFFRVPWARLSVFAVALLASRGWAEPAGAANEKLKALVENHCVDCHGEDVQKAGLRLDTLKPEFADERMMATWVQVFDKVSSGQMPPKNKSRPPQALLEPAKQWLEQALHKASLERQQKFGRVVIRRLNGTEYQNTLHDLLGIRVPLREMLPEDNSAAGFDNVSVALGLSAAHLLLYQQAAEKAIAATVPIHPPIQFSERRTGREMAETGSNFKQTLERSCRLEGDALVIYSKLPRYGLASTPSVPTAGRYKVRMSAAAVGEGIKSIPAGLQIVGQGREQPAVFDCRDIPAGKPQVVELEVDLNRGQAFVVNLLTSWDIRGFKKPISEYKGPGLLVEWIAIEGPIDQFPPPSYSTLFAGVPLKARSIAKAEQEGRQVRPVQAKRKRSSRFSRNSCRR